MSRSKRKGFFLPHNFFTRKPESNNPPVVADQFNFFSRNTIIAESFLGRSVGVYNGKKFSDIVITGDMIGLKFGEFSQTRVPFIHKRRKKKKQQQKRKQTKKK